jgi:hypothetical protein
MKRGSWLLAFALLAVASLVWWFLSLRHDEAGPSNPVTHSPQRGAAPPPPPVTPSLASPHPSEPESTPAILPLKPVPAAAKPRDYTPEEKGFAAHAEARQEIEKVHGMLRDYRTVFGENPVGTNAEIMAALNGGNPKQARLGPPGGEGLNENGELVDRWGTPYFFHQLDARSMEIHSAGLDKRMGTADDLVMR